MIMKTVSLTLIILVAVGVVLAQTPKPRPAGKPAPVVEKAVWNSGWETVLGITEADFRTLGIDAQSKERANQIFSYLMTNRSNFSCEHYYKNKEELKRVHVFVESSSEGPQEFVGQLRSRLSAIHDVSLVYSDEDADIIVKALGFANENESTRQTTGYTASVVVLTPCTFRSPGGYDKGEQTVRVLVGHQVSTGPSEENVLSRVSSTLDVSDLDSVRKQHAARLKLRTD
jgi:hypothetical protein